MSSTEQKRAALLQLQRGLFDRLVAGDVTTDPWWAEHTRGVDPELVAAIVRPHHAANVEARLATYFPIFARWAQLPRELVLARFPENKATGPEREVIEHLFRAALAAVAGLEHAAIWRELLVLERAERLAALNRLPTEAEYVRALQGAQVPVFDDLGVAEVGPFALVRVRSNLIDIYRAYDPRGACFFGPARTAAFWVPPATGAPEPRFFTTLRQLAIELAFV